MVSRRHVLKTSAAFIAGGAASFRDTPSRFSELERRIARHDLEDIYKEDLPTPCMLVDQQILVIYDWPFGATVATVLVAIVLIVNILANRALTRRGLVRRHSGGGA